MTAQVVHIIEDEPLHTTLLDRALRHAHFATALATDGRRGWEDVQHLLPSLILLDLMLPGMSGYEICRLVRRTPSTRHIPIIMLTAVGTEEDRIAGLEMGADDYVVKPFSPREVVSRVQAVLRRTHAPLPETEPFSEHTVTLQGPFFVVSMQQRQVTVSSTELRLLRYMLARDGELVRGEDLVDLPGEDRGNIAPEELDHRVRFLR